MCASAFPWLHLCGVMTEENRLSANNINMNEGLKCVEMCQVLKTEQKQHPSPRQAAPSNQWDSVESDTESLAQERAYQQQVQMRIDQNKYVLPQKENAGSLQHGDGEDEDANGDEIENLQVYDSLEVSHQHAQRNPTLLKTEHVDMQIDEREGTSQQLSKDAYSDLRCDPNWRTNLKGAGLFNEIPLIASDEYYQVVKEKSSQACGDKQGLIIKGGYRYIVDTSPALVRTHHIIGIQSDQPYLLHPQYRQNSPATSPQSHTHAIPEAELSRPSGIVTKNERDNSSQSGFRKCENSCDDAGEYMSRSPELTEDVHTMYIQEFKTCCQQELAQGGPTQTQHMSTSTLLSPKVLLNQKVERLTEDIVERNKKTLGRNTTKCGSYVTAHALKQDVPRDSNKVTQISKGKKAKQKEYSNPHQQQQPPAPGVRDERGDCLSSPLARPDALIQLKPQKTTLSQPLPPTFHLNINLNTSSHLLPLLQRKGQDAVINIASLYGHWSTASVVELASSPGYQQKNTVKSSQMSQTGVNTQLHHQDPESSAEQWQRKTALKWPLSCEGDYQKWGQNEVHRELVSTTSPQDTQQHSPGSGSYTVLPPIGKPVMRKEPELSRGLTGNPSDPIQRSSSDGYLVHMEKQKQLRARATYKAYSLKDNKSDINLRGLGPDYKAIEKTKMKRQRLYSNVIREQNKKISRIPFLPAKDLEGNDKKVPRMKGLEYAKTIAKPNVQSQPKQRQKHQTEGFTERAPFLDGSNASQPATLEVLRKRHEEEKKAVDLFRKVYAV